MINEQYSKEFLTLRRAIFENFVVKDAPIKEEHLTLDDLCCLIEDVGEDYMQRNKRGIYLSSEELRLQTKKPRRKPRLQDN